jgi:signal transduction histidine kinase
MDHRDMASASDVLVRRLLSGRVSHTLRVVTVGELAAAMIHEIGQPLSAINAFAAACTKGIRNGSLAGRALEGILEKIESQADWAAEIVRRFRRFVMRQEDRRSTHDLNQLVKEALELVAHGIRGHGIRPVLRLANRPPLVNVDSVQLRQVVVNLIRNAEQALESRPPRTRRLTITTGRLGRTEAIVSVIDNGIGISAEDLDRVFDPFFTTREGGIGLGLTICRAIVHAHGGRIGVMPRSPHGTTARFTLPLAKG